MYSTYLSSTLSFRCKGPLTFSFNDHSYLLNDSFDGNPRSFSSQSCCACCSNSIYREPIVNPSFLYGLRQSALIQCSASRRLILGGGDRYYCRLPAYDVGPSCCCGFVKERSVSGRRGRYGEGRFRSRVSEEKSVSHRSRDVGIGDVEVMLSLLTEEVGEECYRVRERNVRSLKRVEEEKRGSGTTYRAKKKNVSSGLIVSKSKREVESVRKESREEDFREKEDRRKEDKESDLKGEKKCRIRRDGSSCSSYYSCGSLGELESDDEVQVGQGESSSGSKRRSEDSGELTYDREPVEEVKRRGGFTRDHGVVLQRGKTALGSYTASSGVECDWRKKSEKKLTEESTEQTESWDKSSNKHTQRRFEGRDEKSNLELTTDNETRQQYFKKDDQITGHSEASTKYKNFTRIQDIHDSDQSLRSAGHLIQERRNEQTKTTGLVSRQDEYERNSQKLDKISKIQERNDSVTSISQRQSEARVKRREDKSTDILSSFHDREEHDHVNGQHDSRHTDSRRKFQESTEMSDTHRIAIDNTSASLRQSNIRMENQHFLASQQEIKKLDNVSRIKETNDRITSISQSQSEARVKRREDKSSEILSSVHDTEEHYHVTGQWGSRHTDSRRKFQDSTQMSDTHGIDIYNTSASLRQGDTRMEDQHFLTSQQAIRKTESRKGSQDKSNISVIQSSDAQFINSQRDSKRRISSQEGYLSSVVQSTEETIERRSPTEERVFQIGSRSETQRPTKTLSFSEGTSKEASGSQAALVLKTQPIEQHIGVNVGVEINSNIIVMPPPSQLVETGPLHVEPTSDFPIQEVSSATLQIGSDGGARRVETHEEPLNFINEDALGSADRFQKSSVQFVGEFVEKVKHEVSTSKIQTELVTEGHKRHQKSSSQYGSGDFKSKELELRRSSRSSGKGGPSVDIWDVTDPPIQETSVTEATGSESTTPTTKTVTKRTGRSLWNVISDIVRLRWAPRSDSRHNSPQKSGGRSSPIQSVSSEAWFSGHELDENSDGTVKREKESMTPGSTYSDQHSPVKIPMGSQGEVSSSDPKDKKGLGISASGPESIDISLGPTEDNVGRSDTEEVKSLVSMPSLQLRSLHKDEISEAGKTVVSASGSLAQKQAGDTGLTAKSGTQGRDGELKQRKLQRNIQVPKDRFDEWEEAYKFESEQRRMDEMFMSEALLEAKKAADIWEVPVGAVLVQHGKIIARGYNL